MTDRSPNGARSTSTAEPGDRRSVDRARIVAVWNPVSGGAPEENELRAALGDGVRLVATTEDDPGEGQAREAVAAGATTVVACGGDGTVRACLEGIAGTDTALDVVPLGTSNLLAANLGIPSGLEAAADVGRGALRRVDVGRVNGEAFVVMSGSGFDALMIRDADDRAKSLLGTAAYVLSGLQHLRRPLESTTVVVDGDVWFDGRTSMVLIGNHGTMAGGIDLFSAAEADDGRLDVAVLAAGTVRDWVGVFARLLRGEPQSSDLVEVTSGQTITVRTRHPRAYELDGEARDPVRSLRFTVEPRALLVHDRDEPDERSGQPTDDRIERS